jgi:hypothetical protein
MIKKIYTLTICLKLAFFAQAQIDSSLLKRVPVDTTNAKLNMDAVYNRPFLGLGKLPVSLGGYAEVNWQHLGNDGVSEGHQFQMRRMTLFVASSISKRIKFLSEVEFEEGGAEIAVEFAAIDVEWHPLVNLRSGIVVNPIGSFNQNHDGPKWEFTDRPISATQMLPATWSNVGFGLYGKTFSNDWMFGYEAYLTGGFDNSIIDNEENRTSLAASKGNIERFEEGNTLFTGKVAMRHKTIGELGFSYMGGTYNKIEDDGLVLDDIKRKVHTIAIDYNTTLPKSNTFITGEWAWNFIDVPETYSQQYGNKQKGGFLDIVQPILNKNILGWENATLNLACRLEYVDKNVGTFKETGDNIGDAVWSVMPAVSFRPSAQTVFRLNYRHMRERDVLGNDPSITGGFIFGISTYF